MRPVKGRTDNGTYVGTHPDGTIEHRKNGWLHCKDGPALLFPDGTYEWRTESLLHRMNGPATTNGCTEWWINGWRIFSEDEYIARTGISKEKMLELVLKYGGIS